jgi:hypothetical protein
MDLLVGVSGENKKSDFLFYYLVLCGIVVLGFNGYIYTSMPTKPQKPSKQLEQHNVN